jgi:uncharacterized protein YjbI with pentapeptide repeats
MVAAEPRPQDLKVRLMRAIEKGSDLCGANLRGADLSGARLQGAPLDNADLRKANLTGANLREVRLIGADLQGARLVAADLRRAVLVQADLQGAQLQCASLHVALLYGANLHGADLRGARFCPLASDDPEALGLSTTHATFQDGVYRSDLRHTVLAGADLRNADLRGAMLDGARLTSTHVGASTPDLPREIIGAIEGHASPPLSVLLRAIEFVAQYAGQQEQRAPVLRHADLRGASLEDVTICPEADLTGAKFGKEWEGDEADGIVGDYEGVYRQLKLCFQESGEYDRAGAFFVQEMRAKRRAAIAKGPKGGRWTGVWARVCQSPAWLFDVLSHYGERPLRVVVAGLSVVLLCALLYCFNAVSGVTYHEVTRSPAAYGEGTAYYALSDETWAFSPGLRHFPRALYFSIVTFTSLGYGDCAPVSIGSHFLATTEVTIGVFLMALFMVCIVRRYGR